MYYFYEGYKMTQSEFGCRLANIMSQEKMLDVKINITQLIDKDHLDCTWYGGEVGTITLSDGYVITIGAYGDIRLYGNIDGEEITVVDKSNGGRVYDELGARLDDDMLHALFDSDDAQRYLAFENNNWFEVDLISPTGQWIDLCGADNVLPDNLLECFEHVEDYFTYVDWAREGI